MYRMTASLFGAQDQVDNEIPASLWHGSFALSGLSHLPALTQGLRPGLHSFAASRLLILALLIVALVATVAQRAGTAV